jgi:hypothetical protein
LGIALTGPSFIFADSKLQVTNSTKLESTLKKKYSSICYHVMQESVAMGKSLITHNRTGENLSDLMTKVTWGGESHRLVSDVLYDIYDDHPKNKARPAGHDQLLVRGLKKYALEYD